MLVAAKTKLYRPRAVTVIGALNIPFAFGTIFWDSVGQGDAPDGAYPFWFLLAIAEVIAVCGLLRMKPWAGIASQWIACSSVIVALLRLYGKQVEYRSATFYWPPGEEFPDALSLLCNVIYPLVLVYTLRRINYQSLTDVSPANMESPPS